MNAQEAPRPRRGGRHLLRQGAGAAALAVITAAVTTWTNRWLAPEPADLSTQAGAVADMADRALTIIDRLLTNPSTADDASIREAREVIVGLHATTTGLGTSFGRMLQNQEARELAQAFAADYYLRLNHAVQLGPDRLPFAITEVAADTSRVRAMFAGTTMLMPPGTQFRAGSGPSECVVSYLGASGPGLFAISVRCGRDARDEAAAAA